MLPLSHLISRISIRLMLFNVLLVFLPVAGLLLLGTYERHLEARSTRACNVRRGSSSRWCRAAATPRRCATFRSATSESASSTRMAASSPTPDRCRGISTRRAARIRTGSTASALQSSRSRCSGSAAPSHAPHFR